MPICRKCQSEFPNKVKIDGKWRNIRNRARCLDCQPFGDVIEKEIVFKKCLQCGEEFIPKESSQKFCSHSCAAIYNNLLNRIPRYCLNCGNIINGDDKLYCSRNCCIEYSFEKRLSNYFMCDIIPLTNKTVKSFVVFALGYKCQECGISSWNGKDIALELEHIDGDSTNNKFLNLTLLCPNCHSQTDTYKGKNVGNGRYSRRQRYAEGKSY